MDAVNAPWREDPAWLEAQERYVADIAPEESVDDALMRRVVAAVDLFEIEHSHGRAGS